MEPDYENAHSTTTLQDYPLSTYQEHAELIIYAMVSFFVPFLLGHPQWLVGIIVNATLVLSALNNRSILLVPVIMLPSIALLARGSVFGDQSAYLLLMIPAIWIGNTVLIYAFKHYRLKKGMHAMRTLLIGAGAKALVIGIGASVLIIAGILPSPFLVAMGAMQFWTAMTGGAIAIGIQHLKRTVQTRT